MDGHFRHPSLVIPASHVQTATVIFLHGSGQSCVTWRMVILEALAPRLPHIQWIIPQAPKRRTSWNCSHTLPNWFDVARTPPGPNEFDEHGINESIGVIENLVLSQVHSGIDSQRIVLAGFGQGAALSMVVALSSLHSLGGVISLSGWIPPRARYMMQPSPGLPVLWCHGTADPDIPVSYGQDAVAFLRNSMRISSSKLRIQLFDGLGHAINDAELEAIANWLHTVVG